MALYKLDVEDGAARQEDKRKTAEKSHVCGEGHGWCNSGG